MVQSMRLSGIASGIDTQSIVDQLMMVERIPLNKIYQKKQLLEWKRDDYRSMNMLLKELDEFIFDGVYRKANMVAKTVTSSNSGLVTAIANADASNITYRIENVKLATAARKESEKISSADEKIDPSKSIWSQMDKFNAFEQDNSIFDEIFKDEKKEEVEQTFTVPNNGNRVFRLSKYAVQEGDTVKINGVDFTIKTTGTPADLEDNEVLVDLETGNMIVGTGIDLKPGDSVKVNYESRYFEFDVKIFDENGEAKYTNFKFDGSTSLNNLISRINNSNAGVSLFYDTSTDKIAAMRTETGNFSPEGEDEFSFVIIERDANGEIVLEEEAKFFTSVLGLGNDIEGTGTDAVFTINGLETTRKSNTFTINGVTFTLNKNSFEDVDVDGNPLFTNEYATINISTDTDSIVSTITDFVNKYNEIIEKINGKINEERYRSYLPLTSEEKDALSDKEIERWEEKAKSGMLRRDSILMGALDRMRSNLYAEVVSNERTLTDTKYNHLAEIGITTSKNYMDRGKLEINEEKLRAAIEDNPNAIYQLFMADGDSYEEQGLARRIRDSISDTIRSIEERAGNQARTAHTYTMGKQLLDIEDQIERFESRLASIENRYWKQYTAMEKAMQKLNEQSGMLFSYLGLSMQG